MIIPSSLYNYSVTTLASFPVVLGKVRWSGLSVACQEYLGLCSKPPQLIRMTRIDLGEEAVTISWIDEWLQLYEIP